MCAHSEEGEVLMIACALVSKRTRARMRVCIYIYCIDGLSGAGREWQFTRVSACEYIHIRTRTHPPRVQSAAAAARRRNLANRSRVRVRSGFALTNGHRGMGSHLSGRLTPPPPSRTRTYTPGPSARTRCPLWRRIQLPGRYLAHACSSISVFFRVQFVRLIIYIHRFVYGYMDSTCCSQMRLGIAA